jgi:hypothetical protein
MPIDKVLKGHWEDSVALLASFNQKDFLPFVSKYGLIARVPIFSRSSYRLAGYVICGSEKPRP